MGWVFSRIISFICYKILCGSYDYLYFTGEELEQLAHSLTNKSSATVISFDPLEGRPLS